jgi:hypothetical protein
LEQHSDFISLHQTWCFLNLKTDESDPDDIITKWELCYNHTNRLSQMKVKPSFEDTLIKSLLNELFNDYKRHITVIFFDEHSVKNLRTRLLFHGISDVRFQDLSFLSIDEILKQYYSVRLDPKHDTIYDAADQLNITFDDEDTEAEIIRAVFQKIMQLIPSEVIF